MPRLFTGLEIPQDLAHDLALLRGGMSGARWMDAADYHITLRFLGDIDERAATEFDAELARIRRQPFEVVIEGLDHFGGDRPRALIAKAKATQPLVELQAEQERIARRIGLPPETRKYAPHVTLARLRATSPLALADYLATRGFIGSRRFTAERFVLYSARDSVGGGPYIVEAAYPLVG